MTIQGVGNVNSTTEQQKTKAERPVQITVKAGENISVVAQKFGMTPQEFAKWTGLKKNTLTTGQKINLPNSEVPTGKGIFALAKKYNMTLDEFGKLNKLPKPYNEYMAKKGEKFYVKCNKQTPDKKNVNPQNTNKNKWGSSFSPKEIAATLEKEANDHWGAVGKKSFDDMLAQINPKNASAVIKAYNDADYGQSLLNRITHEVTSSQEARKQAVMHIYDALAAEKKLPASKRNEFQQELNDRFDDWGMVDTEKMDKMIDEILSMPVKNTRTTTTKPQNAINNTKVKLGNTNSHTISGLRKGAIHSAKEEALEKFKDYCNANNIQYNKNKLDMAPLERIPAPTVKNGEIITKESAFLKPTTKPNGKVIILNPGHGGYNTQNGFFDPGSYSFIKKANGKYAPLLEFEKMNIYAESTAEKLRSQGYAVVITNGHIKTISEDKSISNLVKRLNSGEKGGQKYNNKNIMFISLHADSEPGQSGSGICYDSRFNEDTSLANTLMKHLNTDDWIKSKISERNWTDKGKGLQVLRQTENIPSVLVEVEYVNGSKSKNLDSSAYQNRFENKLIEGVNSYFKK